MNNNKIAHYILLFFALFFSDLVLNTTHSESFNNIIIDEKADSSPLLTNELSSISEYKQFNRIMERFLRKWEIKGASVAIARDNKVVYAKGFGFSNAEDSTFVNPSNLFRIASASKLITATAIMKLAEERKLSLKSKVFGKDGILNDSIYLKIRDYQTKKITIENLLRHQGGWTRKYGDPMFMPLTIAKKMKVSPPIKIQSIIQFVLAKRLHFQPGTRSSYSNFGYAVLGEVIAKISGETYEHYVVENILKPMGITDMQLANNFYNEKAQNEVKYYEQSDAIPSKSYLGTGELQTSSYGGTDVRILGAAGGWIATPIDLLKLISHIDAKKNIPDILDSTSVAMMTTPINGHTSPIGWRKTSRHNKWWRTGTLAGSSTLIIHQPNGIDFAVITNTGTWRGPKFYFEIEKAMYAAINQIKKWPSKDILAQKTQSN